MKMFRSMTAVTFLVVFACSFITAQSARPPATWKIEVPFAFHVASRQMPAGVYLIRRDGPFVSVASADRRYVSSFLVIPDGSRKPSHLNMLKFEMYGNEHFLSGIFFANSTVGAKLYLPKQEVELAKRGGSPSDLAVGQ